MVKIMKEKVSKIKILWGEFKTFINRGNAFMLAVGVVIGGAFNAIVTSFVNMLLSIATWPVPGGLKGFVTVLPALTNAQRGAAFEVDGAIVNLQSFNIAEANDRVIQFAKAQNKILTIDDADFIQWKNSLLSLYNQYGNTFTSKTCAVVDWGTLLTAIISFLIIALVLFIMVKSFNAAAKKKALIEEKAQEQYYQKHPEKRPAPQVPGIPEPNEKDYLKRITELLEKQQAK